MFSIVLRLLVITVLVYAGVHFWYGAVDKSPRPQGPVRDADRPAQRPSPSTQASSSPASSVTDDVHDILERDLFQATRSRGEEKERAAFGAGGAGGGEPGHGDQSRLQLSLLGTITGNPEEERAILRDETTGSEELYRVGSEIRGARIGRITRGKVILLIDGREETLIIRDREGSVGALAGKAVPRKASPMPAAESGREKAGDEEVPTVVPRRRISFRSSASRPPAGVPEQRAVAPVEEEPQPPQTDAGQEDAQQPEEEIMEADQEGDASAP